MITVLITGGTGLVGTALRQALQQRGYRVIILSRSAKPATEGVEYAVWDVAKQTIDETAFASADYIIHLAGAGVADKRWTTKRKQEIVDSRVQSGQLLVNSLDKIPNKVKALISASAIGWYGPDPVIPNPDPFTETATASTDFLGTTCRQWEESLDSAAVRVVKLRTGIVLSTKGGALEEFIKPMKAGIAAILGNGKQVISWIHIDDLVAMYLAAIEKETMQGVYNAVAPNPVSNKELTLTLAKSRQRFFIPVHVPGFLLKLLLGEMSIEVLKSATVSSRKIEEAGFVFQYPVIGAAIKHLVSAYK